MGATPGTNIQSVTRALDILQALATAGHDLPLTELAARLRLNESTVHHLLNTLKQRRFVDQDTASREYRLGYGLVSLVSTHLAGIDLYAAGREAIRELRDLSRETSYLSVIQGGHLTTIIQMAGLNPIHVQRHARPGTTSHHSTASGKIYLAHLSPPEAEKALAAMILTGFTPHTITDRSTLLNELANIRYVGYALDREEDWEGIMCIAAPILGHHGEYVGSASIAFARSAHERVTELTPLVRDAARKISENLGYVQAIACTRGTPHGKR